MDHEKNPVAENGASVELRTMDTETLRRTTDTDGRIPSAKTVVIGGMPKPDDESDKSKSQYSESQQRVLRWVRYALAFVLFLLTVVDCIMVGKWNRDAKLYYMVPCPAAGSFLNAFCFRI